MGLVSIVGTAPRYPTGISGDQIPVGARFSAPIRTVPGARPASYTMGTRSTLQVKWPGHGVNHPHPPITKVKGRVQLYFYSPSGPSCPILRWTLSFSVEKISPAVISQSRRFCQHRGCCQALMYCKSNNSIVYDEVLVLCYSFSNPSLQSSHITRI
jgi:hypothetical protein